MLLTHSTTFADEGFLGDEINATVETIRGKYTAWFSEIRILNRILVRTQYELNVHVESAKEMACAALFIRLLVHGQASVILIERGMAASAKIMARCSMEALFNLRACALDYAMALKFLDADVADRNRRAKNLKKLNDPACQETIAASDLDQILADTEQRKKAVDAKKISVAELAEAAGLGDLYLTGYSFLCGAVHSSAGDIDEHFIADADGNPCALVNEPQTDQLDMLLLMVSETMLQGIRALAEVFEVPAKKYEESEKRIHNLAKKI